MELVALIKYLAQSVSPGEFLVITCVSLIMIFLGIKYGIIFLTGGKKLLGTWGGEKDEFGHITRRLDNLATEANIEHAVKAQKEQFDQFHVILREQLAISRELLSQHAVLKQQLDDIFREIHEDAEALHAQLKEVSSHLHVQGAAVKIDVSKNQELIIRVLTQLEKLDEFTKSMSPEFRSTFKDIISSLQSIKTEIALIQQLQHVQINSPGIKLK